jgi:peptidoglycan-N-acetylglucosamine deacetylase
LSTLEIILLILAAVAGANFGIPLLLSYRSRLDLLRRAKKARAVVLTFDDGPGCQLTPAILHLLAEHNAKATFFLQGQNVRGNELLVRQIQEKGHEIGSHGYSHGHIWKTGPWRAIKDIVHGRLAIDAALGRQGTQYSFRPPYGKLDLTTLIYLWLARVPICYWTVDSSDTWTAETMDWRRAAEAIRRNKGGVILVHDFDRRTPGVYQAVLNAVTEVLKAADENQLKVITLSELMRDGSKS